MAVPGGPGPGGPGFGRPAEVRLSALSDAWALFQQDAGTWIVAALIAIVVQTVVSGIVSEVMGLATRPPVLLPGQNPLALLAHLPVMLAGNMVASMVGMVVTSFFIGGMYRMALKKIRGFPISVGDLFEASDAIVQLFIGALLSGLIVGVGALLCVVPGIILAGLMLFVYPLIVDARMSGVDAISRSWSTLSPQLGAAAAFIVVAGLMLFAGYLVCCVGVLVTMPVYTLAVAILYRDFFLSAVPPPSAYPPPAAPPPADAGPTV